MIMGSFRQYLAISTHDHGTAQAEDASLSSSLAFTPGDDPGDDPGGAPRRA
jgi:hypothetical protein